MRGQSANLKPHAHVTDTCKGDKTTFVSEMLFKKTKKTSLFTFLQNNSEKERPCAPGRPRHRHWGGARQTPWFPVLSWAPDHDTSQKTQRCRRRIQEPAGGAPHLVVRKTRQEALKISDSTFLCCMQIRRGTDARHCAFCAHVGEHCPWHGPNCLQTRIRKHPMAPGAHYEQPAPRHTDRRRARSVRARGRRRHPCNPRKAPA